MKYLPNVLSLSRLGFAVGVVVTMLQANYLAAMILLAVGLTTDWLDGYIARRFGVVSKLGTDVIEPVCDMVLAGTALVMLVVTGFWQWWAIATTVLIAALLQLIHQFRERSDVLRWLKRHQNYIHPFFAVIVMVVCMATYIWIATDGATKVVILAALCAIVIFTVYAKRDRIAQLYRES